MVRHHIRQVEAIRSAFVVWYPRLDAAFAQKERVLLEVGHRQHACDTDGGKVMQRERKVEISNGVMSAEEEYV